MSRAARPLVMFVDSHTWEAFSAMAGALRLHGVEVAHVVAKPATLRVRLLQQLDIPLYGRPIRLVQAPRLRGGPALVDLAGISELLESRLIDVQAHDDLVPLLATIPSPLTDLSRRVGPNIDPLVLSDKWVLAHTLKRLGVPTPLVWRSKSAPEFPAVVKNPVGFAGVGVYIVNNQAELEAAWDQIVETSQVQPFVQSFHDGGLRDSAGVALEGELLVSGCYQAKPAKSDPHGPPLNIEPIRHPEIERLTEEVIRELGFTGFYNADWVLDSEGNPQLIDFNARIFGSWPAMQEAGMDFIGAYLYLMGRGPRPVGREIGIGGDYGMLRFPFPKASSRADVKLRRAEFIDIIRRRREFLGDRWVYVSRVKVELATVAEYARLRREG